MDNISSQIGALELGDNLKSHGDGVLEAFGVTPQRHTFEAVCTLRGYCATDAVLEAAGANVANPTGLGCKTQPAMCGY